eukprot:g55987.t1
MRLVSIANVLLLYLLVPLLYVGRRLLLAAVQTFPCWNRLDAGAANEVINFHDLLKTSFFFTWFVHFCSTEFSQETPLCWQAIERFQRRTTSEQFLDIYHKYLEFGAFFEVNLPSELLAPIRQYVATLKPDTPLSELQGKYDDVQLELLRIMQNDTWPRFRNSPSWTLFRQGQKPPGFGGQSHSVLSADSTTEVPSGPGTHVRAMSKDAAWLVEPIATIEETPRLQEAHEAEPVQEIETDSRRGTLVEYSEVSNAKKA